MVSDFEDGGVERNFTHLASGLARLGVETWLLAGQSPAPLPGGPGPCGSGGRRSAAHGSRFLRDFLTRERPDLLLTGKLADDFAAVRANPS